MIFPREPKRILCYGDSNTWGYQPPNGKRLPESLRWTTLLEKKWNGKYSIAEDGLNGRTCGFIDRYKPLTNGKDSLPVSLHINDPLDLIILMLGTNDLKTRFYASCEEIASRMEDLILLIRDPRNNPNPLVPILLICPVPVKETILLDSEFDITAVNRSQNLGQYYQNLARKYDLHYFDPKDVFHELGQDGCHFTKHGHRVFAELIFNKMKEAGF